MGSAYLLPLLAVCCAIANIYAVELESCERTYDKIGCFTEKNPRKEDLLINDRQNVQWHNIKSYLHNLACKCAKLVKEKNKLRSKDKYVGFALHYYGECYGRTDKDIKKVMVKEKEKHRCVGDQQYVSCEDDHQECTGRDFAEYIYELKKASAPKDINGGYSAWMNWTACTPDCGLGVRVRERTCTNPLPQGKGNDCQSLGANTETEQCKTKDCPIEGGFTKWSAYGKCSKVCGGGLQSRQRTCTNPAPSHGGRGCDGKTTEERSCNAQECPINGGWSDWGSYGACSVSCGGGKQKRLRGCTNPRPQYEGAECSGKFSDERNCNTAACPVHGGYSSWSAYGSCSKSCGYGKQSRTRSCLNPKPAHGGKNCNVFGAASETRYCNKHSCPVPLSREYTARVCENKRLSISCSGSAKIMVTDALYGRKTKGYCKSWLDATWSTNCKSSSSWSKVTSACNGKSSCSVQAKNNVFGDPCFLTPKYLQVKYRCKG